MVEPAGEPPAACDFRPAGEPPAACDFRPPRSRPASRAAGGSPARLLFLLLALVVVSPLAAQSDVGSRATPITVTDLDGNSVRLDARAAGKPMLIEFWATWCEVCEALMPTMRRAAAQFGEKVDIIGINVTVNESKTRVRRWVEKEKPPYRTLYDESGLAVRTFGAPLTSYIVIIDADGVIRYTGVGADQDLLAELGKVVSR